MDQGIQLSLCLSNAFDNLDILIYHRNWHSLIYHIMKMTCKMLKFRVFLSI